MICVRHWRARIHSAYGVATSCDRLFAFNVHVSVDALFNEGKRLAETSGMLEKVVQVSPIRGRKARNSIKAVATGFESCCQLS